MSNDLFLSTEELEHSLKLLEQAEMKEFEALKENPVIRAKKSIVLKRLIARRAVLLSKAHADPLYDKYVGTFKKLVELRSIILQKYGSTAKVQAMKSSGITSL
jgi:hypothetical protein